jgi:glycosyltransferase involved in cell wall biosynthesis
MKITFFANPPSFIPDIAEHFARMHGEGSVNVFVRGDQTKFAQFVQTSDIIWFEWCNELMLYALANFPTNHAKVICRLHSYEAFTDMPSNVDWKKVDHLILVNESLKDILRAMNMLDKIENSCQVHVIPNLVTTKKFNLTDIERKRDKIAYLGHINYKKDSSMILPIMEKMRERKQPHRLCVGGEHQDLRYKIMFDRYMHAVSPYNIEFNGHQKEVDLWLEDKKFSLNTSLFESFNYGIAESMLSGAIPLVRNWLGSELAYPHLKTWNTVQECVNLIEEFEALSIDDMRKIQEKNRQFIIETYDFDRVIPRIEDLMIPKIRMH